MTIEKHKKFSDEQIQRVNNIDLVDMLRRQGETLKKIGKVYRWMRYDSTVIYGQKWFRHSRQVGGGPIQFMKEFYNMDFVEAVKYLLGGEDGAEFARTEATDYIKPEFKAPKFSDNMHRTFAYLTKTRKIDADVVQFFVKEKKIFETAEHHNIAFVGYDERGEMKQAHLRSTQSNKRFFMDADGSDKQYYFRYEGKGQDVFVFEAPIDMLSYITMNKDNWQEHNYVCLGGVALYSLENILKNNPNINTVHICVDNDKRGHETAEKIEMLSDKKGIECDRLLPKYKDWNEDLQMIREQEQNENFDFTM